MKRLARLLTGLIKAIFFFTLFAFALNNQHEVVVHFFFGHQWTTSLVVLVLLTLCLGVAMGVLAMVPAWWKHRRRSRQAPGAEVATASPTGAAAPTDFVPEHPPREGL